MVYPILKLNDGNTSRLQIIDTEYENNPVFEFSTYATSTNTKNLIFLLKAFINQYNIGYNEGYTNCLLDDMEEFEDE